MNRYLSEMIEILMRHGAVIDEIIGDGILAFFGAPEPMEDHPLKAVSCAIRMQRAMDEINAFNRAYGIGPLEMGIAVNSGDVIVGNIGSRRRTKYGVVGHQVNFTGRMESLTVGGQVLLSSSTFERVKHVVEVGEVINVKMKGFEEPVKLYEAVGILGESPVSLRRSEELSREIPGFLEINVALLKGKVVSEDLVKAVALRVSSHKVLLSCSKELAVSEDIELGLPARSTGGIPIKVIGKVVAVGREEGGEHLTEVRFTSPSFEVAGFVECALALRRYLQTKENHDG